MICVSNGKLRSRGTLSVTSVRLRQQLPLVRADARVDAIRHTFVALGAAELVRLPVQQAVKRRFHAAPNHLVHMTANLRLVDLNHAS